MKTHKEMFRYEVLMARIDHEQSRKLTARIEHHKQHDRKPPTAKTIQAYSAGYGDGWRECLATLKELGVL